MATMIRLGAVNSGDEADAPARLMSQQLKDTKFGVKT